MFFMNLKNRKKCQDENSIDHSEILDFGSDKKSEFYNKIAESMSMIELEKELQSNLNLLI